MTIANPYAMPLKLQDKLVFRHRLSPCVPSGPVQAMEFQPFKAARAAGLRLDDSTGGAKGAKGKGKAAGGGGAAEDGRERSRSRN